MDPLRISVAMCTYNGAAHLPDQLASLARQTRRPDQVVIVDDASDDSSAVIAEEFASAAPFRVAVHRNPVNLGYRANFGRAIGLCDGDVIALCDQDDVWLEEKVARVDEAFRTSGAGMVFSDARLVDDDLRVLPDTLWEAVGLTADLRRRTRSGRLLEALVLRSVVTGATMAFRRPWLPLILPIEEPADHDAWIALLVSAVAGVAMIEEPLILYRQHGRNQIGARRSSMRERWEQARNDRFAVLAEHREVCARALRRLRDQGFSNERVQFLESAVRHLDARSSLPRPRLRRALPVARLIRGGAYGGGARAMLRAIGDLTATAAR